MQTTLGALFTSSEMMHISPTSAISLAVGSSLIAMPGEAKLQAVFMLALMVGIIQIVLGRLKMSVLVCSESNLSNQDRFLGVFHELILRLTPEERDHDRDRAQATTKHH